jgi:ABC-type branched-subunit amino acid transport system substrate-binding protein
VHISHTSKSRARGRRAVVGLGALVTVLGLMLPVALGGATASTAVTDYVKFVGGKAGKANPKLRPVVVGLVNQQGGQVEVGPLWTPAIDVAVKLVNDSLGGIGGHPLVLKKCFIRNAEEEGTRCGQQMANDRRVAVVLWGGVVIGNQSFYSALGGKKPVVGGVLVHPIDEQYKPGFGLFGSGTSVLSPYATFAKNTLKAKTAAVVYPQIPGIAENGVAIVNAMRKAGLSVKQVGYDPNATDLVGPITAAGGQSADVFVLQDVAAGCVNMAKALAQLRLTQKVLTNPLCLDPRVAEGLGGDYPKWTWAIASSLGFDTTDKGVAPFVKVYRKYRQARLTADPWTPVGFGQALTLVKWLNKIGWNKVTTAAIVKQARAFRGPVPLGAPTVRCGKLPALPAVCNDQTQFFEYLGAGKFKRVSSWVAGPK